jgi:HEAT repeat protein
MSKLNAEYIIQLLEVSTDDRRPVVKLVSKNASITELVIALQNSTGLVRQILCDILGERQEQLAIPVLINCLNDTSPGVRSSTADALGKIGDSSAGEALLKRFDGTEKDTGVRQMLGIALGAVGYKPAIPFLIQALKDTDTTLRGCAAWSLGVLKAKEAEVSLEQALLITEKTELYTVNRIQEALKTIRGR